MLKPVGLFGVRRRLNQIVNLLNGEADDGVVLVDLPDWISKVNAKMEGALVLFGRIFRKSAAHERRLKQLEKWQIKCLALEMVESMGDDINDECIGHMLETIEALEARIVSLEEQLLLRSETPETSESDHG